MKRTKKILLLLFLISLMIFSLAIPASAEEGEIASEPSLPATDDTPAGEGENVFELVYAFFEEHSSETFSLLAFIGSLAVALLYKKGMIPALAGAVGSVGKAVCGLREDSGSAISSLLEQGGDMLAKIGVTEKTLAEAAESLSALSEKLKSADESRREMSGIKTVILAQIDLLYDIFMASSLPQYRKDDIGERVSDMKRCLEACDNEEAAS